MYTFLLLSLREYSSLKLVILPREIVRSFTVVIFVTSKNTKVAGTRNHSIILTSQWTDKLFRLLNEILFSQRPDPDLSVYPQQNLQLRLFTV
jgi:hypothetical protein